MKKYFSFIAVAISLLSQPAFSQEASDSTLLGLPGDNLDLYAVLDLFQKSKTIEAFEKSLNDQKTGINNLDLDLDKKVDFIKVVTKQKDSSFTFILQDAVSEKETQDVAVILVDKDKNGKVTMQIVGDVELYGKNYVVEPKPPITANPGYTGADPVATTKTVVVESTPVVQYVYSPVYVPYVPPYYYGYYPPYYAAFTVMAIGIYHSNHYYHGGYGYHNTVVIHNHNNYNNYNGNRNHSDRVSHNNSNGRYNNGNKPTTRPSTGGSASTRPATTNRRSDGSSAGTGASTMQSNRGGNNNRAGNNSMSPSNRQSPSNMSSPSRGGRSMGGGGFGGGGGSRGGGGFGGGGGGRRR